MLKVIPVEKHQESLNAESSAFHLKLSPGKLLRSWALIALCLVVIHLGAQFYKHALGHETPPALVSLFDVTGEGNIPTWFSSSLLLACSLLLSIIAINKKSERDRYALRWAGLAACFLFISVDEAARIHELFVAPVRSSLGASGFLYYAWVIPYGTALLTLTLLYLRFFFDLPKQTRLLFFIAGVTYVSGAVGLELVEGFIDARFGADHVMWMALSTLEELQEMAGLSVFAYALLSYMVPHSREIVLTISGNAYKS